MIEVSLKTIDFGLKPDKFENLSSPALKGGAIDLRDLQGFSHINKNYRLVSRFIASN